MEPETPTPVRKDSSVGPTAGIVIIVLLLLAGGIYFLLTEQEESRTPGPSTEQASL